MKREQDYSTIIEIGDVIVSSEVITEFFACNYAKCKGCCCIIGDSGAPLREEELQPLEDGYPAYSAKMTPEGRAAIDRTGFFDIDRDGDLVTPCVPSVDGSPSGACAYMYKGEDGGCRCAIETCHLSGGCAFRKPISCSLYPIRVTQLAPGREALNLHRWAICRDAFEKGAREGIRVYQFLREPLIARYGASFYQALSAAAEHLLSL